MSLQPHEFIQTTRDLTCPEISSHATEIANVPRPKLFVHKINEKLKQNLHNLHVIIFIKNVQAESYSLFLYLSVGIL